MGAIQEPTSDMGPYGVEVRRESFYLNATGDPGEYNHVDGEPDTLSLPADHVPYVLAALDQVTGHAAWKEWSKTGTHRQGAVAAHVGDHLVLRFQDTVYLEPREHDGMKYLLASTEVEYADVDHLRSLLAEHA
jgi:hypothetical protein